VNGEHGKDLGEGASLLAVGRTADVFYLGDGRVLRRYRNGAQAVAEVEFMRHVARHGFPVPTVFESVGPDLVMELLEGPTMVESIAAGDLDVVRAGRMLGDLHNWLHRLPARTEGSQVLHMELHPLNVIMVARRPVVIDWGAAREGEPALDVAMTALILGEVAVSPDQVLAPLAGELLRAFVSMVPDDAGLQLDNALRLRRVDPHLAIDEQERLGDAAALVRTAIGGGTPH
jgi:tRNA A-37 threonylcarbamoyl transferase component Bud32